MKKIILLSVLILFYVNTSHAADWWYGIEGQVFVNDKLHNISTTSEGPSAPKIIFDNISYPVDFGDNDILRADLVDKNGIRTYIFIARLDALDFPVNWQWAKTFVHFPDKSNCSETSQFGFGVSQKPSNLDVWINGNCFQGLKH